MYSRTGSLCGTRSDEALCEVDTHRREAQENTVGHIRRVKRHLSVELGSPVWQAFEVSQFKANVHEIRLDRQSQDHAESFGDPSLGAGYWSERRLDE